MKYNPVAIAVFTCAVLSIASTTRAQRFGGFDEPSEPRWGVPTWEIDPRFKADVFTFCRIQYSSEYEVNGGFSGGGRRGRRGGRGGFGRNGGFSSVGPPDYNGNYGGGWGTDG